MFFSTSRDSLACHRRHACRGIAVALLMGLVSCLSTAVMADDGLLATHADIRTMTRSPDGKGQSAATVNAVQVTVSAAQAARAARHEYGGRVLAVVLEDGKQMPYYRVKLLSGGRVHVVHVEAHQ